MEILHNPRCSKSRTTLNIILENNIQPTIRLYLDDPLSIGEIKDLLIKLNTTADQIVIKCAENAIKINILQRPGKKIMSSKDVINGWSIIKGSKMENIK